MSREATADERLNEVLLTYLEAAQAGQHPDREAVLAAHPELRADLEAFFASHDQVERLAAPLRNAINDSTTTGGQRLGSARRTLELGQLGDFRLLREVGRGGMGVVYEAEQISLQRRVALKILPFAAAIDPRQLQRFRNEALAAAHLRHESIVPVFAVGSERGVHYYAMQFIDGQSLAALIGEMRRLAAGSQPGQPPRSQSGNRAVTTGPYHNSGGETFTGTVDLLAAATISQQRDTSRRTYFEWAARLGRQAAQALEHAHQMGIVHRDIKPANLLLDPSGRLWVADFGLAQVSGDAGLTITGEVLGTLRYASPEQAMARPGLVSHRSDIYSLGATLYELLTLRPIFDGKDRHELLRQIAQDEPVAPRSLDPAIPVDLETILLKAVAKEPADRYATAGDLADDLQRFLDDRPIQARRPSPLEKASRWARRHRSLVVTALVALFLCVIGLSVATALTIQAYDRERKKAIEADEQRALAEGSFKQAQKAVHLFEQIGEEELAGDHRQQRLRQRLLEAALVYYQDFIDQRHDDPMIQAELEASRARVKTILGELATVMGAGHYAPLHRREVQDELNLSQEQREELDRIDKKWRDAFGKSGRLEQNEKDRAYLALAQEQERIVARLLTPPQYRRFKQIAWQFLGPMAFSDPEVTKALKLTADQTRRIRAIQDQPEPRGPRFGGMRGKGKKPGGPRPEGREDEARKRTEKIMKLLTAEQNRKWRELTGAPFKMKPSFPPLPPKFPRR